VAINILAKLAINSLPKLAINSLPKLAINSLPKLAKNRLAVSSQLWSLNIPEILWSTDQNFKALVCYFSQNEV